jgi:hypothetical protein
LLFNNEIKMPFSIANERLTDCSGFSTAPERTAAIFHCRKGVNKTQQHNMAAGVCTRQQLLTPTRKTLG